MCGFQYVSVVVIKVFVFLLLTYDSPLTYKISTLQEKRTGFYSVPDLGQMRSCASLVMRHLTLALKEVAPVVLHRPSQAIRHTCSENLGIVKISRYIRSERKMPPPLANGALCLR